MVQLAALLCSSEGDAASLWLTATALVVAFFVGGLWERSGWGARVSAAATRRLQGLWQRDVRRRARCRLVGSGPGDPALLTDAARQAIFEADVVIADRLVPQETLALVKGRLVMSRKYKGCANRAQDELHDWTLEALAEGLDVVRLKGGDPFMYGRGAEEIAVFRRAGFDVEVVPGISSALSAPLSAGIAVTTRGCADQLLVATGHGMNDTVPRDVAPFYAGRTTVYLMSVGRMERLMQRLMEPHVGYPGATPVAVIEKATTREQRVVRGTVSTIAAIAKAEGVQSPATIVVGRASEALLTEPSCGSHDGSSGSRYQFGQGSVRFAGLAPVASRA